MEPEAHQSLTMEPPDITPQPASGSIELPIELVGHIPEKTEIFSASSPSSLALPTNLSESNNLESSILPPQKAIIHVTHTQQSIIDPLQVLESFFPAEVLKGAIKVSPLVNFSSELQNFSFALEQPDEILRFYNELLESPSDHKTQTLPVLDSSHPDQNWYDIVKASQEFQASKRPFPQPVYPNKRPASIMSKLQKGLIVESPVSVRLEPASISKASQFNFYLKNLLQNQELGDNSGSFTSLQDLMALDNNNESFASLLDRFWLNPGPKMAKIPYKSNGLGLKLENSTQNHDTHLYISASLSPWRLSNINSLPNSLLGALQKLDVSLEIEPVLLVGNALSTDNWVCEDNFLQYINHQIAGYKLWYIVPELEFEKFESLKESKSSPLKVSSHIRLSHKSDVFQKLVENNHKNPSVVNLIKPSDLDAAGIKYYMALQKPGEYIIKYPKTYSLSVSLGTSISEELNFASSLWLKYGLEGEKWLHKQHAFSKFSFFKLLVILIQSFDYSNNSRLSLDNTVHKLLTETFESLCELELEKRTEVREKYSPKESVVDDKSTNYASIVADDDFGMVYPTKICLVDEKSQRFNTSLENFQKYIELNELEKDLVPKTKSIPHLKESGIKVEMHLFQSDEKLKNLGKILANHSNNYEEWIKQYEESMNENYSLPLKTYRTLLAEGERIYNNVNSSISYDKLIGKEDSKKLLAFKQQLKILREFILQSNDFVDQCQSILANKHQQRIRNMNEDNQILVEPEDILPQMIKLIDKVPSLNFDSPEIEQLIEFKNEIENFERSARLLVSKESPSLREFDDLINLGRSFGIRLRSLEFITRIRESLKWIKTYEVIITGGDPFNDKKQLFTIQHLLDFYKSGFDILGSKDLDKLKVLEKMIENSNMYSNKIKEFLDSKELNEASIRGVDHLIEEIDEKFKLKNEDRIFIDINEYDDLLGMRASLDTLQKLYSFNTSIAKGEKFGIEEAEKLHHELKDSKLPISADDWKLINTPIDRTKSFVEECSDAFSKINLITTTNRDVKNSELKGSICAKLVKSLQNIIGKCSISFSDEDKYTASSPYFAHQYDVDPDQEKLEAPLNPQQLYCLCREYEYGSMIECDECKEWYHDKCITAVKGEEKEPQPEEPPKKKGKKKEKKAEKPTPVKQDPIEEEDEEIFICPICILVKSGGYTDKIIDSQITDFNLIKVVFDLNSLSLRPAVEFEKLNELNGTVQRSSHYLFNQVYKIKESDYVIDEKIDRLYFLLRKIYGAGILIDDLLYEVLTSIRKYKLEKRLEEIAEQRAFVLQHETTSPSQKSTQFSFSPSSCDTEQSSNDRISTALNGNHDLLEGIQDDETLESNELNFKATTDETNDEKEPQSISALEQENLEPLPNGTSKTLEETSFLQPDTREPEQIQPLGNEPLEVKDLIKDSEPGKKGIPNGSEDSETKPLNGKDGLQSIEDIQKELTQEENQEEQGIEHNKPAEESSIEDNDTEQKTQSGHDNNGSKELSKAPDQTTSNDQIPKESEVTTSQKQNGTPIENQQETKHNDTKIDSEKTPDSSSAIVHEADQKSHSQKTDQNQKISQPEPPTSSQPIKPFETDSLQESEYNRLFSFQDQKLDSVTQNSPEPDTLEQVTKAMTSRDDNKSQETTEPLTKEMNR